MKKLIIMSGMLLVLTGSAQAQSNPFPVAGCAGSRWIGSPVTPRQLQQFKEELNQVADADTALKMKKSVQLASGWFANGNIVEGESLMAAILQQSGAEGAPIDPLMAQSLAYQAELALCRKEFDRAEQYYQHAIKLYVQLGNANAPLISVLLSLAGYYYQQGRFAEGEVAFERADALTLAGARKLAPKESLWADKQVVELWRKGDVPAAMAQARAVVERLEVDVATLQQKVVQLTTDFEAKYPASGTEPVTGGKAPAYIDEAIQKKMAAQSTLRSAKNDLRQRQYRLALALNAQGELLHAQRKYSEAEAVYLSSLAKLTQTDWDKSLAAGRVLSDLGQLYRAQGANDKAQSHQVRALAILLPVFGAEHPDVMEVEAELAFLRKPANQPGTLSNKSADKSTTTPEENGADKPANKLAGKSKNKLPKKSAQKADVGK